MKKAVRNERNSNKVGEKTDEFESSGRRTDNINNVKSSSDRRGISENVNRPGKELSKFNERRVDSNSNEKQQSNRRIDIETKAKLDDSAFYICDDEVNDNDCKRVSRKRSLYNNDRRKAERSNNARTSRLS